MAQGQKSQRSLRPASSRTSPSERRSRSGPPSTNDTPDDLAHQISQPLAAIVSFARGCQLRARNQNLSPEDLERALESIVLEALRAGTMLRTLRETMENES